MKEMWIHDGTICFRLDGDEEGNLRMMRSLLGRLRRRGFQVQTDRKIERDYPSISRTHYEGRRGDLQFVSESYRLGMKFEFFQNIYFSNPNGGRYDFDRVDRMPFLIRMRWLWTLNIIREWCEQKQICCLPGRPCPIRDPLGSFNDRWDSSFEKSRGIHRFERGADGWPSERELSRWGRKDADGQIVNQGDVKFCRVNGRWLRGVVHGGINGMWLFSTRDFVRQENASCLRSLFPGRGRDFPDPGKRQKKALDAAVQKQQFLRAHKIQQAMATANS